MSDKDINEIHTVKVTKKPKPNNQQPSALLKRPKISEMVLYAIRTLNEKGGSSLQAIKKFLASTYCVDIETSGRFIKSFLKKAVQNDELIQTRGKGASGSFKINPKKPPQKSSKKKAPVKTVPHRKSLTKLITKVTTGVVKKPKVTNAKAVNSSNEKLAKSKVKNLKSPKPSSSKILAKPKKLVAAK